jgi:hypothetical protein
MQRIIKHRLFQPSDRTTELLIVSPFLDSVFEDRLFTVVAKQDEQILTEPASWVRRRRESRKKAAVKVVMRVRYERFKAARLGTAMKDRKYERFRNSDPTCCVA